MLNNNNEKFAMLREALSKTSISLVRLNKALKGFEEAMEGFNNLITSVYTK